MSPTQTVWGLTGLLFAIGFLAAILRRQLLAMFLGLELMANAANIPLVYYACLRADALGLAAVFLLVAVAAAETVVGLSLIVVLSRNRYCAETNEIQELHG